MKEATDVLTVSEFAGAVRVSEETIYRGLSTGQIRGFKHGHGRTTPWRIPKGELDRLMRGDAEILEVARG